MDLARLPARPASPRPGTAVAAARRACAAAGGRAAALDAAGGDAFPADDVADLARGGLLLAPVPAAAGGLGLGSDRMASPELLEVLRLLGRGSLPLGRVYEGHVNAWRLIGAHGTPEQRARLARDAAAGHLFAVWNTETPPGLRLARGGDGRPRLEGAKAFATGAGHVTRPLVTARAPEGVRMVAVRLGPGDKARAEAGGWRPTGMRASASGRIDLTDVPLEPGDLLGPPDAYEAEPDFSAGAWRFLAVQLGGIEALGEALRLHLRGSGRGRDPQQERRLGEAAIAAETARLWAEGAMRAAAAATEDPAAAAAYVALARLAVERAALDLLERAQRSIGVQAFLEPHPAERLARDLATYLRQPAPDRALGAAARHVLDGDMPLGEGWAGFRP